MAQKKKAVVKKTRARKTPKKQVSGRKVTRRKRKTNFPKFDSALFIDIEQVYKAINKVQLAREEVNFAVIAADDPTVLNIIKDLGIPHVRNADGEIVRYWLKPSPEATLDETFENLEDFPDEIIEDGQVF